MQRLKTRPQFQAVLAGSVIAKTEHFALHRNGLDASVLQSIDKTLPPVSDNSGKSTLFAGADLWLGAMAPKRWAKRAVTRNAIKRQIYTVSADFSHQLPHAVFLVRLRRDFSRKEFASASSESLKQAVRAELISLMRAASVAR